MSNLLLKRKPIFLMHKERSTEKIDGATSTVTHIVTPADLVQQPMNNRAIKTPQSDASDLGMENIIPYNPYDLQSGDNLGLKLIPTTLIGENYASWSILMKRALNAKNKMGFVSGKILQPKGDSLIYDTWDRCNDMVVSWLINLMSKEIAYLIWKDISDRLMNAMGC